MDDRTALLLAWLEGETERRERPVLPPPEAKAPASRGWVVAGVCALGGTLALGLVACWLADAWGWSTRAAVMDALRQEGLRVAAGDPTQPPLLDEARGAGRGSRGGAGWVAFVRAFATAFGTVAGALFLRAGCLFHNRLVGGGGVPEPPPGKAMAIAFLTALVNAVLGFELVSSLVSLPVMAVLCSALLPTTFARACKVVLCSVLVGFSVVVSLAVVVGGLGLFIAALR